jgi:hypothetical protein
MALSKESLSMRIYTKLVSEWGVTAQVPTEGTQAGNSALNPLETLKTLCDAIAEGVVMEIVQNAQVQTIAGAPDGEHIGIVF